MTEWKRLRKNMEAQGWTVRIRPGTGHLVWTSPTGQKIFSSFTPSDIRAIHRHRSLLRKAGAVL